jgi:hypothetical protein
MKKIYNKKIINDEKNHILTKYTQNKIIFNLFLFF